MDGFSKIDLLYPQIDGLAIYKSYGTFTLQIFNETYMVGKFKKGFDYTTSLHTTKVCI
jgi:hypothetical protein